MLTLGHSRENVAPGEYWITTANALRHGVTKSNSVVGKSKNTLAILDKGDIMFYILVGTAAMIYIWKNLDDK
jgi:alkyl sulfatase BDS1-like metallo-beta-lactamase superfamily hydrolase